MEADDRDAGAAPPGYASGQSAAIGRGPGAERSGLARPVILLPTIALTGLTSEQWQAILAHELAHVRRSDYLINSLQTVVETLLFYHPAVWWVSGRIRLEREHCCDELAVAACGDAAVYMRALAEMEHLQGVPEPALSVGGGSLVRRVRHLAGADDGSAGTFHKGLPGRWRWW